MSSINWNTILWQEKKNCLIEWNQHLPSIHLHYIVVIAFHDFTSSAVTSFPPTKNSQVASSKNLRGGRRCIEIFLSPSFYYSGTGFRKRVAAPPPLHACPGNFSLYIVRAKKRGRNAQSCANISNLNFPRVSIACACVCVYVSRVNFFFSPYIFIEMT